MTQSHKIADSLYLVRQTVNKTVQTKPVEVPTNHIAVIDCSGSMSYDLPKIREQMKKKLPKMLREQDTISIIWFSGRGEFGTLLEAEPVATLSDLKDVNAAIDRWIKPVGMTGFKEPLEEVTRLTQRVSKKRPGSIFSLFFMSDGCDNQFGRAEVLKAVESASVVISSSTFVEYGYYADRPLLTSMAEKAGGSLIFAEDFDRYMPQLEAALKKKSSGAPRVEAKIQGDTIGGFAFTLHDGDLVTFSADNGVVSVSKDTDSIYYLSPSQIGTDIHDLGKEIASGTRTGSIIDAAYAAVSLYSVRMRSDSVYPILKVLGDVRFIESFSSCFGKQKYSEFMDSAKNAAFGLGRYDKGYDPKKVPRDDAFTVLEMLQILSDDDENRILLENPSFKYSRIGRGRVDASTVLTDEEQTQLIELTNQIASERDVKKLKDLQVQLSILTSSKGEALKFVEDLALEGYSISNLVFNEDRPNISLNIRKTGSVDLSSKLPKQFKGAQLGKVPEKFPSFKYRNYTIVKDGLVNVKVLPVHLSESTSKKLSDMLKSDHIPANSIQIESNGNATIYLDKFPVINRSMMKSTSAKSLFELDFKLIKARAAQKVYNTYKKERFPGKKSESFEALYGKEAADWLKDQGFTDYSGFSPKSVQADSTDVYMRKELVVSIKGLSSLPSLKEAKEKLSKGKVNSGTLLMKTSIEEVDEFLSSKHYINYPDKDSLFETWIDGKARDMTSTVRNLIFQIAKIKFSIIVGQCWFSEWKSLDENTMTLDIDGQKYEFKADLQEKETKI